MTSAVLSDDESDHEQGTHHGQSCYLIINEAWRSKELVVWFRMMDLLACGEKWGGRHVAHQGNSRCICKHSTRSKDGTAVSGLPENCYDPEWLKSLKQYQRDQLDVQPPVDLTFSNEEKQYTIVHFSLVPFCVKLHFTDWQHNLYCLQREKGTPHMEMKLIPVSLGIGFYVVDCKIADMYSVQGNVDAL